MRDLLARRLLWIGGKGGVGKTSVAAGLAMLAARRGRRTLVVSTDPAHSLGDVFDRELGDAPRRLLPNLDALEIDPDAEVDAHLKRVTSQLRRFTVPRMMDEMERQMRLSRQSPGAQEAALLERIARLVTLTDDEHDLLIFDTAPTGHTLRLLSLPEAMAAWTDGLLSHSRKSDQLGKVLQHLTPKRGRDVDSPLADPKADANTELDARTRDIAETLQNRRRLFVHARRAISDPTQSNFVFVLTPERLPILETLRAVKALGEAGIPIAATVVNRVIPTDADGEFLRKRRELEADYLARIDRELSAFRRPRLPLLDTDVQGIDTLEALANHLEREGF